MMVTVAAVCVVAASLVFLAARLRASYVNEVKIAGLEAELAALNQKLTAFGQAYTDRLSELEVVVYGTLEPQAKQQPPEPPARPSRQVVETWQQNRDATIQKRLLALEQRLLKLEPTR